MRPVIAILLLFFLPLYVGAQQAVVELRSTVKGNQEQPKVLYIVPWQQPLPGELTYRPLQTLVSEVFAPVDREEFVREIDYRARLRSMSATESSVNNQP